MSIRTLCTSVVAMGLTCSPARAEPPSVEEEALVHAAIHEKSLVDGVAELDAYLAMHPESDHARLGLATARFLRSGERLFQSLYQRGLNPQTELLGMMLRVPRWPAAVNPDPEEISYEDLDAIILAWLDDLREIDATLAAVKDADVKLRVRPGIVRMDFNADGVLAEEEALWSVFNTLGTRFRVTAEDASGFDVALDRGDVSWLRGYCHVLMGVGELMLAHDGREMFERTAHLMFARPVSPHGFLRAEDVMWRDEHRIMDWIAFIHLTRFPVRDAERAKAAREHFRAMLAMSREMWSFYSAETDNDREWLPNPNQVGVMPGAEVTPEMRDAWLGFTEEADAVLRGERLLRFWRPAGGKGVNLNRVFTEPREFDLVLWIQGSAATPYLEDGQVTTPGIWDQTQTAFQFRFFRHAFWFN